MTQHNQQNSLFVCIYLCRAGELHFLQVHLSIANYVAPDVGQPAPLLEGERAEIAAAAESKVSDAPDALRNGHLLESAFRETLPSNNVQPGARLKDNLT